VRCPYHPEGVVSLPIPADARGDAGWIGWLEGCCSLPVWRCARGELHPIDAQFCTYHGCERPPPGRVTHEVASGPGGRGDVAAPGIVQRVLEHPPHAKGTSTPALAGNVLCYLAEGGRLLALDLGSTGRLLLTAGVQACTLKVRGGDVIGALAIDGGMRYLAWDLRDIRDSLRSGTPVAPREIAPTGVHLLGLPTDRTRLHQGTGALRLVVEHDPVPDDVAEIYQTAHGVPPGEHLVRRTGNPLGPRVPYLELRPQVLRQVPVPVPGGTFLLGQVRWFGKNLDGALIIPTVAGYVAGV
jgi:hypothetical protein